MGATGAFDAAEPPHNIEAEQAVLGAMMLSKDAISDVVEILRADDFYRPAHQIIFEVVLDLFARGDATDMISVWNVLLRAEQGRQVGGAPYLHDLVAVTPVVAAAAHHARIVHDQAILRRLIEAGIRIASYGRSGNGEDVSDLVDRAQADVYNILDVNTAQDYQSFSDMILPTLDEIEAIGGRAGEYTGIPTGFADLDRLTQGLHPGQLVVVAARPAVGKSTLGLDFSRHAAIRMGLTTVIFSLEMSRSELMMKLLSAEARIPLHRIRSGSLSDADWSDLAKVIDEIGEAPLFVDPTPHLTMMEIRAKCRRLKQKHDLRLVVVDYLQLMSSPSRRESRQQEVAEMSRSMKLLAKELDIPVVAICQLNRGSEQRADKRPQISDLRESGAIEQDADVAILIHREDVYDRESPRAGEADLIVAKQRNGPTATIPVAFQGHYSRFVDMKT
jgi:replicative DNA helicase